MTTADEPLSTLAPFPAALPDATLPAITGALILVVGVMALAAIVLRP